MRVRPIVLSTGIYGEPAKQVGHQLRAIEIIRTRGLIQIVTNYEHHHENIFIIRDPRYSHNNFGSMVNNKPYLKIVRVQIIYQGKIIIS